MTTGNNINPLGNFQIALGALCMLIGAVIQANILGNVALIIGDLNQKD